MSVRSRLVLTAAFLACVSARAEDPPKPDRPASWTFQTIHGLAVSRDGAWLAARTDEGLRLLPASGGFPVRLEIPKEDWGGWNVAFSPDSKWVVAPGVVPETLATSDAVKARPQTVHVFPTSPPCTRRGIEIPLKAEPVPEWDAFQDESIRGKQYVRGEATIVLPYLGPRVILERDHAELEMRELASGSKFKAPVALRERWACGISEDGTRCVRLSKTGIELVDLTSNRVLKAISAPAHSKKDASAWYPGFSPDGSSVLVLRTDSTATNAEYVIECWSAQDGKKRWETTAGRFPRGLECAGGCVATIVDKGLRLFDLRDGTNVACPFPAEAFGTALATADGKGLWVIESGTTLRRVDIPALPQK